jgi:Domain of unknown function (DUF222)
MLCDLSVLDDADLRSLSSHTNRGIGLLEGFATRIAGEAHRREGAGAGVTADEVARGDGEVSRERARARTARAGLGEVLPQAGAAARSGSARPENADALAGAVAKMTATERERLVEEDADLARRAANDDPEVFARHLKRRARDLKDPPVTGEPSRAERQRAASFFGLGPKANGMWWLQGELDPERARVINDRLRARARRLAGDEPLTGNHLAQALYDYITGTGGDVDNLGATPMGVGYLVDAVTLFSQPTRTPNRPGATGRPRSTAPRSTAPRSTTVRGPAGPEPDWAWPGDQPHQRGDKPVVVAESWSGEPIEADEARRLACNADLYAILINHLGQPGPVGLTRRTATRQQRLALRALYPTCPLDGTTPFERCEIHHVNLAYEAGGETELANLVPIAAAWHHRCHEGGWTLKMDSDRTLHLIGPDGTLRTIPPPTPITRQRE